MNAPENEPTSNNERGMKIETVLFYQFHPHLLSIVLLVFSLVLFYYESIPDRFLTVFFVSQVTVFEAGIHSSVRFGESVF
jgi:hypothetical protein